MSQQDAFTVIDPECPNPVIDPENLAAGPGPYYVIDPNHSSPYRSNDPALALAEALRNNGRLVPAQQIAPELR